MDVDKFKKIHSKYDSIFKEDLKEGKLPMRSTRFGFWGTSSLFTLFDFFQKINLETYDNFLDLGSGDGRVVLLASLFTNSVGIEGDLELLKLGKEIMKELDLDANFHMENYMLHDLSKYDFIFIYPDKGFTSDFEEKIRREFKGKFFVYNQIYTPHGFKKVNTITIDGVPIIEYTP